MLRGTASQCFWAIITDRACRHAASKPGYQRNHGFAVANLQNLRNLNYEKFTAINAEKFTQSLQYTKLTVTIVFAEHMFYFLSEFVWDFKKNA